MFNTTYCKNLIMSRGYYQYQVAEKIGYAPSHLSKVLQGKYPASTKFVAKLSEFFGVPVSSFYEDNPTAEIGLSEIVETCDESVEDSKEVVEVLSSTSDTDNQIIDNQYILDALTVLKHTCEKHEVCKHCPLCRRDGTCGVTYTDPKNYNIVPSTHWTAFRL